MATLSYMAIRVAELPDIFTRAEASALGISDRRLAEMRQSGAVSQLARGIYLRDGVDVDHDLAEITLRAPRATLCLTTALAHHDLTDDIPASINIALPREQRQPRTTAPVTWHRRCDPSSTPTVFVTSTDSTKPTRRSSSGSPAAATNPARS